MKLKVFYASDGDCLLLTSKDGHHALVDGGRRDSFQEQTWPALQAMAEAKQVIDLVLVSHIDADHISGILWLIKAVAAWAVHDYQTTDGGNPTVPTPLVARPPAIKKLWHNSWRAQLGDLAGPIETFMTRVSHGLDEKPSDRSTAPDAAAEMFDALQNLAESIPDGVELRRLVDDETPIPRNTPFGDLVLLKDPPYVEKLGTARLTVIGPAEKHLERLREEWRDWLAGKAVADRSVDEAVPSEGGSRGAGLDGIDFIEAQTAERTHGAQLVTSLTEAAQTIVTTDPSKVTPPNRASITVLAEEGKRTCLLTGDAAEEEILEGLEAAGRIVDGRVWCDVLKVQHHGSEHNLSQNFARTVIADQYVFCADGAHGNPDPSVVKTIIDSRPDSRPFTIWFNCSPERTLASRRSALSAAIREASASAKEHPNITVRVLEDAEPFFEIRV